MITTNNLENKVFYKNPSLLKSLSSGKNNNYDFRRIKKFKKFKTVVLIGMGGSILGSKAIYSFLKHKIKKNFIFIDNLDFELLKKIEIKKNPSKFLFIIISKSGNTTETIVNTGYFKNYFKKNNLIIISEKKDNILYNLAKKKDFFFIKHNPNIGGRYSVFSEVGMVPAYLMGLSPLKIKKKLFHFFKNKKSLIISKRYTKKIYQKKIKALVFFNYVPQLNDFLFWCQQLLAESLGKNKKGFIPVVSNAPKDHHSLMQLYLDGPKDKLFYVFSSKKNNSFKFNNKIFGKKVKFLHNKNYSKIKNTQKKAFIEVLKISKIPFREFEIKNFNEKILADLFLLFIFETILLANLMGVDAFNQPAVEKVKILTKKFLS